MLNIDGLRICPRDAGIILPALEAVERDVGAWIREVRAHVLQSRAAQRDCAAILAAREKATRASRCELHRSVSVNSVQYGRTDWEPFTNNVHRPTRLVC
jgi:hypothetical protein